MIRLSKDAPWEKVELPENIIINKTQWIDETNINYAPIKKWVEFQIQEIKTERDPYEGVSNGDLIALAKEKNIYSEWRNRQQTIEILLKYESYNKLTKKELIAICEKKEIDSSGKTKTEMVILLTKL